MRNSPKIGQQLQVDSNKVNDKVKQKIKPLVPVRSR